MPPGPPFSFVAHHLLPKLRCRCAAATAADDEFQLVVPCYATGHFVRLILPGADRTLQIAEITMCARARALNRDLKHLPNGCSKHSPPLFI